jgi:DNA ligase D-like protein (predicted polymerase)
VDVLLTVEGRDVLVTNADRVLFPELGVTKEEVVRYFVAIAPGILDAIRDRPTMLERWRTGVAGDGFFQRRPPRGAPDWVQTVRFGGDEMICPSDAATVAWAANLGTLTFHPAPMRRGDLGRIDQLQLDLDPQPGTGFREAARVAHGLRELLDEHGLTGFPKTSGGRGIHVLVPIEPRPFAEAREHQTALGAELARRMPDIATVERLKRRRGERVYVDCGPLTVASAYSIRPTPRALVSAPLTWDELDDADPAAFDVRTVPARFAALAS